MGVSSGKQVVDLFRHILLAGIDTPPILTEMEDGASIPCARVLQRCHSEIAWLRLVRVLRE
jgi:hypothetical protein